MTKPNNPLNNKLAFGTGLIAIAMLISITLTTPLIVERIAISLLGSAFLTPIIYGVLVVNDAPKQILSNTLAAFGVIVFFLIFAMPDTTLLSGLSMLGVSATLLYFAERLDSTGRNGTRDRKAAGRTEHADSGCPEDGRQ